MHHSSKRTTSITPRPPPYSQSARLDDLTTQRLDAVPHPLNHLTTEPFNQGHNMPTLWNSDDDLFALAKRELFTAVVGDVMDKLGLLRQFLSPQIQPLREDMVVIGRAMPVLEAD